MVQKRHPDFPIDAALSGVEKKLFKRLEGYLSPDEKIVSVVHETYVPAWYFGWLVLTNKRVIVAKRRIGEFDFEDFSLVALDIDFNMGKVLFDEVKLSALGKMSSEYFYIFEREEVIDFIDKTKKEIAAAIAAQSAMPKTLCDSIKSLDELYKLKKKGAITDAEFKKTKKRLLNEAGR